MTPANEQCTVHGRRRTRSGKRRRAIVDLPDCYDVYTARKSNILLRTDDGERIMDAELIFFSANDYSRLTFESYLIN